LGFETAKIWHDADIGSAEVQVSSDHALDALLDDRQIKSIPGNLCKKLSS
jgi:hypothetical protein